MAIDGLDVKNLKSAELVDVIINGKPEELKLRNDDGAFACVKFTNFCSNACNYCTDSRDNWDEKRDRLTKADIVQAFRVQYENGIRNFILYGGVDLYFDTEKLCALIKDIKAAYPESQLYVAFGEKVYEAYQAFKAAGADGFYLPHRSANEDHFARIHPMEMYPYFRKQVLPVLRQMGFKIGTGITVGWPFQTAEILAEDIEFVRDLNPELVVIESFVPQTHTPYENHSKGDKKQTENVRGIVGMMLPEAKILTGL